MAGAGFTRVFRTYPGDAVVGEIESTVVIDQQPPAVPLGVGTGTQLLIGEFENGPLEQPLEVFGGSDLEAKFGGLGFNTPVSPHDGAVARQSGGNEAWNGNAFIWLSRKKFSRLVCCRVDNSAGSVAFTRQACLTGGVGPFSSSDGDQLVITLNTGDVTAQTDGAKAELDATGASFPVSIENNTIEIKVDAQASKIVTFTSAETSVVNVVDRINAVMSQTIAFDNSGQVRLRSIIEGANGRIEVLSGTAVATLGFPTAAVAQVSTYTVNAQTDGVYTLRVQTLVSGLLVNFDATHTSSSQTTTQLRDSLTLALQALNIPGVATVSGGGDTIVLTGDLNVVFTPTIAVEPTASDVTVAATTPPVLTVEFGTGNVGDLASYSAQEAATIVDLLANVSGSLDIDGRLVVCNTQTPGSGTINMSSGALVTPWGFDTTVTVAANVGEDLTIPFGSQVSDGTTVWVTIEDIETGTGAGPFSVKVRPFSDDDTALPSTSGTITTVVSLLSDGFSVTNAADVTRLSGPQLDARYSDALDATLDLNTPAGAADTVAAARASESVMRKLLENSETATSEGLRPRKCIVRPLLGTSITDATSSIGTGVGITRSDRRQYAFPGVTIQIPEIQAVGSVGGTGFTDDGIIEVGSDSFLCSIVSILPPEQNAGQTLQSTNVGTLAIINLEDAFNPAKGGTGLKQTQYTLFKSEGITAPRIDEDDGALFQSDETTSSESALKDGSRRRMADFIIASTTNISSSYIKKLATARRRLALTTELRTFLDTLKSEDNPDIQRIDNFSVIEDSSSTQNSAGIISYNIKVKTLFSIKNVVLRVQVGTTVQIEEAA